MSDEYKVRNSDSLASAVSAWLNSIDKKIARLKLIAMEIRIDKPDSEQNKYLSSRERKA